MVLFACLRRRLCRKPAQPDGTLALNEPSLSALAHRRLTMVNPFLKVVVSRLADSYGPDQPEGLLNIGVAENTLMYEWLTEYFAKDFKLTCDDLTYSTFNGGKALNQALCSFFANHFHPLVPVKTEHLIVGTGISSVLDQLSSVLCNPGDGVMLATPYYNGFNNLASRSQLVLIPVNIPEGVDPSSPEIMEAFEARYRLSIKSKGPKPKAVILCNPHNPLGFCHQKATILAYMKFCEKYNLHLISDEIYALSVYQPKSDSACSASSIPKVHRHPFISVLSIDPQKEAQCNPARVHLLYGMSKDFGANGLRIGVLVSQHNRRLIDSLSESTMLMKTSNASNNIWNKLIRDENTLAWFIQENQRRLSEAYDYVVEYLNKRDIPHNPSYCGHYVLIDLRRYLPSQGNIHPKEQEMKLFLEILNTANVYLAPGSIYNNPEAGWFRLTFAMRRDYLDLGLQRIDRLLDNLREQEDCGKTKL